MALSIWAATCRPGNIAVLHGGAPQLARDQVRLAMPAAIEYRCGGSGLEADLANSVLRADPIFVAAAQLDDEFDTTRQRDVASLAAVCCYETPRTLIDGLVQWRIAALLSAAAVRRCPPVIIHDVHRKLDARRLQGAVAIEMDARPLVGAQDLGPGDRYPTLSEICQHATFLATSPLDVLEALFEPLRCSGLSPIIEHWRFNLTSSVSSAAPSALIASALARLDELALDQRKAPARSRVAPTTTEAVTRESASGPVTATDRGALMLPIWVDPWTHLQASLARITAVTPVPQRTRSSNGAARTGSVGSAALAEPIGMPVAAAVVRPIAEQATPDAAALADAVAQARIAWDAAFAVRLAEHAALAEQMTTQAVDQALQEVRKAYEQAASEAAVLAQATQAWAASDAVAMALAHQRADFDREIDDVRARAECSAAAAVTEAVAAITAAFEADQVADEADAERTRLQSVDQAMADAHTRCEDRLIAANEQARLDAASAVADAVNRVQTAHLVAIENLQAEASVTQSAAISAALEGARIQHAVEIASLKAEALRDQITEVERALAAERAAFDAERRTLTIQHAATVTAAVSHAVAHALAEAEAAARARADAEQLARQEAQSRLDQALDFAEARGRLRLTEACLSELAASMIALPGPGSGSANLRADLRWLVRAVDHASASSEAERYHASVHASLAATGLTHTRRGVVSLAFTLNLVGHAEAVAITRSSGYRDLDDDARAWVFAQSFPVPPVGVTSPTYTLLLHVD